MSGQSTTRALLDRAPGMVSYTYRHDFARDLPATLDKIHQLERSNALLEVSNKQWEAVAKEQRANAEKATQTLTQLQKELLDAEKSKTRIEEGGADVVSEKDVAKAQELIDRYEENVRRCMEIASGSPRTESDKENALCP